MTLNRSLLLGSATALVMGGAAQAADLPVRKAAPVDYVRVCDFAGAGFFYIPGTDTCLQIGGIARAEYAFVNGSRTLAPTPGANAANGNKVIVPARDRDLSGFLLRSRLNVDLRTQTAYGTVRAYIQYQIDRQTGYYSEANLATGNTGPGGSNASVAGLRRGFIQFAGITAGRVQSFYDFYADNYNYESIANSDTNNEVLAYTYTFVSGFTGTLSLEDRNTRNLAQNVGYISGGTSGTTSSVRYGGEAVPDVVAALRVDQAWGSAQLSAAYRDITTESGPFAGTASQGYYGRDANGFAVQGGLRLKLPMLAAGDDLWLEGAYGSGAYCYVDSCYSSSAFLNSGFSSSAIGGFQHIDRDVIAIHTPGSAPGSYSLQKGEAFSGMLAFNHYFSPNFHDILFGSYEQVSYGRAKNIDWTLGGLGDGSGYRIGNQFLWDPIKNLEIGIEFDYLHIDQTLAHNVNQAATPLPAGIAQNPSNYEVRLRMERDF